MARAAMMMKKKNIKSNHAKDRKWWTVSKSTHSPQNNKPYDVIILQETNRVEHAVCRQKEKLSDEIWNIPT